ncbi:hypothetical protein Q3G72_021586 [Acer saccharum]|nr:hypothetical protein Q3G72_021586 [Acer saccharum]
MKQPTSSVSSRTNYSEHRTVTHKVVKSSKFRMTPKVVRISLTDSNATDSSSDEYDYMKMLPHTNSVRVNPLDHIRPKRHRPVVLPLPRAGGSRCSVKPASRCALHFRNHESLAFAKGPWPNSWLGMGKPVCYHTEPDPVGHDPTSHHLNAPTWVTSPRDRARRVMVGFDKLM